MKKDKYDISIVIPVYNCEKYIDECLESIINQTYTFDKIQIILIFYHIKLNFKMMIIHQQIIII